MRQLSALALTVAIAAPAAARVMRDDTRARPTLDGTEQVHDTADGRFRIRYTLDGGDALEAMAEDESPANGLPDAVDAVAEGLVACWQLYVDGEGWRAPGDDGSEGGDGRLDIYLRHIDHNGLAHQEWHGDHWAAYLEIEPDVANLGWDLMASVAAHELHHAIQYSYTVGTHSWVHESSATYAQYRLYGEPAAMAAALQLLWSLRLEDPGIGLDVVGDRLEYASLIWVKYLVDRSGGDLGEFRRWWEILALTPDWRDSLEELAAELDEPDALTLAEGFAEWLYFACARDDGQHWATGDGLDCLLPLEATLVHAAAGVPAAWQIAPPPDAFGAALATVDGLDGQPLVVRCDGPADASWSVRGVSLDREQAVGRVSAAADEAGVARLDVDDPGDTLLIVLAYYDGPADAEFGCEVVFAEAGDDDDDDSAGSAGLDPAGGCACAAGETRSGIVPSGLLGMLAWLAAGRPLSGRRGR
jgi:hypothetical protein